MFQYDIKNVVRLDGLPFATEMKFGGGGGGGVPSNKCRSWHHQCCRNKTQHSLSRTSVPDAKGMEEKTEAELCALESNET